MKISILLNFLFAKVSMIYITNECFLGVIVLPITIHININKITMKKRKKKYIYIYIYLYVNTNEYHPKLPIVG